MKKKPVGLYDLRKTPSICPWCGGRLTGAGSAPGDREPRRPKPGDFGVCIYCAGAMKYGPDLALERLPASEIEALPEDERASLRQVMAKVRQAPPEFRKRREPPEVKP